MVGKQSIDWPPLSIHRHAPQHPNGKGGVMCVGLHSSIFWLPPPLLPPLMPTGAGLPCRAFGGETKGMQIRWERGPSWPSERGGLGGFNARRCSGCSAIEASGATRPHTVPSPHQNKHSVTNSIFLTNNAQAAWPGRRAALQGGRGRGFHPSDHRQQRSAAAAAGGGKGAALDSSIEFDSSGRLIEHPKVSVNRSITWRSTTPAAGEGTRPCRRPPPWRWPAAAGKRQSIC